MVASDSLEEGGCGTFGRLLNAPAVRLGIAIAKRKETKGTHPNQREPSTASNIQSDELDHC